MANEYAQDIPRTSINRQVWIINDWVKPYTQEYRGRTLTIPPNGKKEVHDSLLEANSFVKAPNPYFCPPNNRLPDGGYPQGTSPKMLRIVEFTDQERKEIEGIGKEEIEAEKEAEEQSLKLDCTICAKHFPTEKGLKLHTSKMHPEFEPVLDEKPADVAVRHG